MVDAARLQTAFTLVLVTILVLAKMAMLATAKLVTKSTSALLIMVVVMQMPSASQLARV
jgi:hypothetical protein